MNEDIITMLDEQIKAELGGLSGLAVGSKEHTEAIEGLAKLYRLRIDDSKAAMEYNKEIDDDQFRKEQMEQNENFRRDQMQQEEKLRHEQMEQDERLRHEQMEQEERLHMYQAEREEQSRKEQLAEQKKDRYIKIGIAAAELMVPLVFFAKIYQMGYDLEKDGTFTVQTLKNLIRFVKPTKR